MRFATTALAVLGLAFVGCRSGGGEPSPTPPTTTATATATASPAPGSEAQRRLDVARTRWMTSGPARYRFVFRWNCFCPPPRTEPVVITVASGVISSVVFLEGGAPVVGAQLQTYRTVDGLLEFIQDTIDRQAASIEATYDATYGFPATVAVDYIKDAVDEEQGFVVERFEPVP